MYTSRGVAGDKAYEVARRRDNGERGRQHDAHSTRDQSGRPASELSPRRGQSKVVRAESESERTDESERKRKRPCAPVNTTNSSLSASRTSDSVDHTFSLHSAPHSPVADPSPSPLPHLPHHDHTSHPLAAPLSAVLPSLPWGPLRSFAGCTRSTASLPCSYPDPLGGPARGCGPAGTSTRQVERQRTSGVTFCGGGEPKGRRIVGRRTGTGLVGLERRFGSLRRGRSLDGAIWEVRGSLQGQLSQERTGDWLVDDR